MAFGVPKYVLKRFLGEAKLAKIRTYVSSESGFQLALLGGCFLFRFRFLPFSCFDTSSRAVRIR